MRGEKILVTGPAGQIAFPMCAYLASDNEVWGVARFGDPAGRAKVDALGVTTKAIDLADGDLSELPDDFTYLLHLAVYQGADSDFDRAIAVNAEATGRILAHCRKAKAALVMSTASVYSADVDPYHQYTETDPVGYLRTPWSPTYTVSKICGEAVARTCARLFGLPVVIARMNASYGSNGGLPTYHLDTMLADLPVVIRHNPCPYSLIHQDDINAQTEALLGAASVPATVVNWGGDDVVTPNEWCAYYGELTGRTPEIVVREAPGSMLGNVLDPTKRLGITGPCAVGWKEGLQRVVAERHPESLLSH
ncbi:MAG TPA: NAD(P)-dependent oxidoreductase [Acidimicrobiales bacterium]|nr:NAD(P)-dependent oxidoreductase [Acidimicrobiales bacterium]